MPTTPVTVEPVTLAQLTEAKVDGAGVFDTLMRAAASHIQLEFDRNRIKGQDYAQVYLTAIQYTLANATAFLMGKDKAYLDAKLVEANIALVEKQAMLIDAQISKTVAETTNLAQELLNMKAQECLLTAQYDLTMLQKLQTTAQTALIQQKIATEKAQTVETGVDENSVIGRQKSLYKAQTEGFARDAEQKAAKMLIDTWNVRRTTDEGTVADATNMLNDATIGRAVTKVLTGVNA